MIKICPKCNAEVEENFNICWRCNYSFTEEKIVEFYEKKRGDRDLNCLRCNNVKMVFAGNYKFHEGPRIGILGSAFEIFQNRETFDLYLCPKCGKVEFFTPL